MDAKAARARITAAGGSNEPDDADVSELDGPYARIVESVLGSLAKQTRFMDSEMRHLKDTKITSYFERT